MEIDTIPIRVVYQPTAPEAHEYYGPNSRVVMVPRIMAETYSATKILSALAWTIRPQIWEQLSPYLHGSDALQELYETCEVYTYGVWVYMDKGFARDLKWLRSANTKYLKDLVPLYNHTERSMATFMQEHPSLADPDFCLPVKTTARKISKVRKSKVSHKEPRVIIGKITPPPRVVQKGVHPIIAAIRALTVSSVRSSHSHRGAYVWGARGNCVVCREVCRQHQKLVAPHWYTHDKHGNFREDSDAKFQVFDGVRETFNGLLSLPKSVSDALLSVEIAADRIADVSRDVSALAPTIISKVDKVVDSIPEAIDDIQKGAQSVDNAFSIAAPFFQIAQQPVALLACVKNLASSVDIPTFICNVCVLLGLLGVEKYLIDVIVAKLSSDVQSQGLVSDIVTSLVSLLGFSDSIVESETFASMVTGFHRTGGAAGAVDKFITAMYNLLDWAGIYSSEEHVMLKNIKLDIVDLIEKHAKFAEMRIKNPLQMLISGHKIEINKCYLKVVELRKTVSMLKDSPLRTLVENLHRQYTTIRTELAQADASCGIRQKPAGFLIYSNESQIGKSQLCTMIIPLLQRRLAACKDLDSDYEELVEELASWTSWSQNVDDKYDQGYIGQEVHYIDDVFCKSDHTDHPQFLSKISTSMVLTVQADMESKGRPYMSKIVLGSSNAIPKISTTIRNLHALWERFTVVSVTKVSPPPVVFDPEFKHLRFSIGTMVSAAVNPPTGQNLTLDDVLDEIIEQVIVNKKMYCSVLESMNMTKLQMDTPVACPQTFIEDVVDDISLDGDDFKLPESIVSDDYLSAEDEHIQVTSEVDLKLRKTPSELMMGQVVLKGNWRKPAEYRPFPHEDTVSQPIRSGETMQRICSMCKFGIENNGGATEVILHSGCSCCAECAGKIKTTGVMVPCPMCKTKYNHDIAAMKYMAYEDNWSVFVPDYPSFEFDYVSGGCDLILSTPGDLAKLRNARQNAYFKSGISWVAHNLSCRFKQLPWPIHVAMHQRELVDINGLDLNINFDVVAADRNPIYQNGVVYEVIWKYDCIKNVVTRIVYCGESTVVTKVATQFMDWYDAIKNKFWDFCSVIGATLGMKISAVLAFVKSIDFGDVGKTIVSSGARIAATVMFGAFLRGVFSIISALWKGALKVFKNLLGIVGGVCERKKFDLEHSIEVTKDSDSLSIPAMTITKAKEAFGVLDVSVRPGLCASCDYCKHLDPYNRLFLVRGYTPDQANTRATLAFTFDWMMHPSRAASFYKQVDKRMSRNQLLECIPCKKLVVDVRDVAELEGQELDGWSFETDKKKGSLGDYSKGKKNRYRTRIEPDFGKSTRKWQSIFETDVGVKENMFEMVKDPSAQAIAQILNNNLVRVRVHTKDMTYQTHGVMSGSYAIVPGHLIRGRVLESIEVVHAGKVYAGRKALVKVEEDVGLVYVPKLTLAGVVKYLNPIKYKDMGMVNLNVSIQPPSDAFCYFANASYSAHITKIENKMLAGLIKYSSSNCPIPTSPGDCGAPLIIHDPTIQGKWWGIHIAGGSEANWAQALWKEDMIEFIKEAEEARETSAKFQGGKVMEFAWAYPQTRFLSNFYPVRMGVYSSVESYYQNSKLMFYGLEPNYSLDKQDIKLYANNMLKDVDKTLWLPKRLEVMRDALMLKFRDTAMRKRLDATKGFELVHVVRDRFWGMFQGIGNNELGKMLMDIRDNAKFEDDKWYDTVTSFPLYDDLQLIYPKKPIPQHDVHAQYLGEGEYVPCGAETKLRTSVLYSVFPVKHVPTITTESRLTSVEGLNKDTLGKPSLIATQTAKWTEPINEPTPIVKQFLDTASEELIDFYDNQLRKENLSPLLEREVLEGTRDCDAMQLSASPGYHWNKYHSTKRGFIEEKDGHRQWSNSVGSHNLQKVIKKKLNRAMQRERVVSVWMDKLKDETRPLHKYEKPRVFTAAPFDSVFLSKKFFGRFKEAWGKYGYAFGHAVGVSPISRQWTELYSFLTELGPNGFDADFTAFDGRLQTYLMEKIGYIINTVCQRSEIRMGLDPSVIEQNRNVRDVLFDEFIHTIQISRSAIYVTHRGNCSGNPLTTQINSMANYLMHWFVFAHNTGIDDLAAFKSATRIITFGDDVVCGVDKQYEDYFNLREVKAVLAEHLDQKVTAGNKLSDYKVCPINQVQFLSRKFVEKGTVVLAPLKVDSIEQAFNYTNLKPTDFIGYRNAITESCVEAYLHGKEYYDNFYSSFGSFFEGNKLRNIRDGLISYAHAGFKFEQYMKMVECVPLLKPLFEPMTEVQFEDRETLYRNNVDNKELLFIEALDSNVLFRDTIEMLGYDLAYPQREKEAFEIAQKLYTHPYSGIFLAFNSLTRELCVETWPTFPWKWMWVVLEQQIRQSREVKDIMFRGMSVKVDLKVGDTFRFPSITSLSEDRRVSESYGNYLFILRNCRCAPITYKTIDESEYIISGYRPFEVLDTYYKDGKLCIEIAHSITTSALEFKSEPTPFKNKFKPQYERTSALFQMEQIPRVQRGGMLLHPAKLWKCKECGLNMLLEKQDCLFGEHMRLQPKCITARDGVGDQITRKMCNPYLYVCVCEYDNDIVDSYLTDQQRSDVLDLCGTGDIDVPEKFASFLESIEKEYCCEERCMKVPVFQVDDVVCDDCHNFGYCKCGCYNVNKNIDVEKFCCEYRCFKRPYYEVDGKACDVCNYYNFCRCRCVKVVGKDDIEVTDAVLQMEQVTTPSVAVSTGIMKPSNLIAVQGNLMVPKGKPIGSYSTVDVQAVAQSQPSYGRLLFQGERPPQEVVDVSQQPPIPAGQTKLNSIAGDSGVVYSDYASKEMSTPEGMKTVYMFTPETTDMGGNAIPYKYPRRGVRNFDVNQVYTNHPTIDQALTQYKYVKGGQLVKFNFKPIFAQDFYVGLGTNLAYDDDTHTPTRRKLLLNPVNGGEVWIYRSYQYETEWVINGVAKLPDIQTWMSTLSSSGTIPSPISFTTTAYPHKLRGWLRVNDDNTTLLSLRHLEIQMPADGVAVPPAKYGGEDFITGSKEGTLFNVDVAKLAYIPGATISTNAVFINVVPWEVEQTDATFQTAVRSRWYDEGVVSGNYTQNVGYELKSSEPYMLRYRMISGTHLLRMVPVCNIYEVGYWIVTFSYPSSDTDDVYRDLDHYMEIPFNSAPVDIQLPWLVQSSYLRSTAPYCNIQFRKVVLSTSNNSSGAAMQVYSNLGTIKFYGPTNLEAVELTDARFEAALEAVAATEEDSSLVQTAASGGMTMMKAGALSIANQTIFEPVGHMLGRGEAAAVKGIDGLLGIKTPEERQEQTQAIQETNELNATAISATTLNQSDRRYYKMYDKIFTEAENETDFHIDLPILGEFAPLELKQYKWVRSLPSIKVTVLGVMGTSCIYLAQGEESDSQPADIMWMDPLCVNSSQPLMFTPDWLFQVPRKVHTTNMRFFIRPVFQGECRLRLDANYDHIICDGPM